MRLEAISLKNFGPYRDITLDLTQVQSAIVTGPNGAGKSVVIVDAVRAALYGRTRSTMDDMIRTGETDMMMAVTFGLNQQRYRVIRKRSIKTKAGKSDLELQVESGQDVTGGSVWTPMSGGRMSETQEKIVQLLNCDDDLLTATSFFLQGQADRFSKATPTERKTILAGILRLDRYAILKSAASREALKLDARMPDRQQAIEALDQAALDLAAVQVELATAELDAQTHTLELERLERERTGLVQRRADLQAQLDGMDRLGLDVIANRQKVPLLLERERALTSRHARLSQAIANRGTIAADEQASARIAGQIRSLEDGLRDTQSRKADLMFRLDGLTSVREACESNRRKVEGLQGRERILRDKAARWEKILANGPAIREKTQQREALLGSITDAEARLTTCGQDIAHVDADIDAARQKDTERLQTDVAITTTERAIADAVRAYRLETQRIRVALEQDRAQAGLLDQVPCDSGLQARCQFTLQAVEAKGRIDTHEQHLDNRAVDDEIIISLDANEQAKTLHALKVTAAELAQWAEKLHGARTYRAELMANQDACLVAHANLKARLPELERYTVLVPELELAEREAGAIGPEINLTLAERDQVEGIIADQERELLEADAMQVEALTLDLALNQNATERARLATTMTSLAMAIGQATEAVQQAERDLPVLELELASAILDRTILNDTLKAQEFELLTVDTTRNQLDQATDNLNAIDYQYDRRRGAALVTTGKIGGLAQRIASLDRTLEAGQGLRLEMANWAQDLRQFRTLADAYAIIPTLVMENALPILEQETNALLGKISRTGMRVRFDTQKALKSRDGLAETLDIAVRDIVGERPLENYSGGERFRLDLAIRIGLSRLLARRAGAKIETLVIDEGLGSLDEDGLSQLRECLGALGDDFGLVLVITHVDAMKATFPSQIQVTKDQDGSHVEVLA